MSRRPFARLIMACSMAFSTLASANDPRLVEAPIDTVTIFPFGALVLRQGTTALPAGVSLVEIAGLPDTMLDETIQVGGKGQSPVSILDVRVVTRFRSENTDERRRALDDKLQELMDAKREIDDHDDTVGESKRYLQSIRSYQTSRRSEPAESEKPTSIEDWRSLIRFQEEELEKIAQRQRELAQQRRQIDKEIEATKLRIDHLKSAGSTESKSILVNLESTANTAFNLELSYMVDDASWGPLYDVRADTEKKSLTVVSKASIQQSTSENWDNVAIKLSTASPNLDSAIPELHPWRISGSAPGSGGQARRPNPYDTIIASDAEIGGLTGNFSGVASNAIPSGAPADKLAEFLSSDESSSIAATEFSLPYRVSLASDSDPQIVAIKSFTVSSDIYHWAMPKASETTFLKARATNTSTAPMLPGSSQVFVDGRFVAASEVPLLPPGAELNLLLGPSARFSVKRTLVNKLDESVGFNNKNTRVTYEYNFALENLDAQPQLLVLRDQIPVSGSEEIAVKLLEPAADQVEIDKYGMLIWRVTLEPKEKRDLKLKFSIQYPKDWYIVGL